MKLLYAHFVKYLLSMIAFFVVIVPGAALGSVVILVTVPIAPFIGIVNNMTSSILNALDHEIDKSIVINKIKEVREKYIKDI